ncbi:MAG: hypothetical protein U7127_18090 [Phormidium sp.]
MNLPTLLFQVVHIHRVGAKHSGKYLWVQPTNYYRNASPYLPVRSIHYLILNHCLLMISAVLRHLAPVSGKVTNNSDYSVIIYLR